MFNKVDGFIKDCDGTKYLELFGTEKYNVIFDRIRYLVRLKSGATYAIFHNYAKIKFGSHDDFPLEDTLILDSVITLIKSVFNESKNHYYCSIHLENIPINKLKDNWNKTF